MLEQQRLPALEPEHGDALLDLYAAVGDALAADEATTVLLEGTDVGGRRHAATGSSLRSGYRPHEPRSYVTDVHPKCFEMKMHSSRGLSTAWRHTLYKLSGY